MEDSWVLGHSSPKDHTWKSIQWYRAKQWPKEDSYIMFFKLCVEESQRFPKDATGRCLGRDGYGESQPGRVKFSSHESANKNHLETQFCCCRIIICANFFFLFLYFKLSFFFFVCKHFLFCFFEFFLCWLFILNTAALKIWNITDKFHIYVFPLSSPFYLFPSKSHCRHNFNVNSSKASTLLLMIYFSLLKNVISSCFSL